MVALCDILTTDTVITELKASGKGIGADGARAIGRLLASGKCALRHVAVGDTSFGSAGGLNEVRIALEGDGASFCPLHVLDLSFKGLRRTDAEDLKVILNHCPDLRQLDVSRNPLGGAGLISALAPRSCADTTPRSCALVFLELSETELDATAIGSLADMEAANKESKLRSLQAFHAARNPGIGDTAHVGRMLAALPSLTELHLQGCGLGWTAAGSLGAALRDAPNLGELKLDDNPAMLAGEGGHSLGTCQAACATAESEQRAKGPVMASQVQDALPSTFIHSAIPTRTAYEASLQLPREERLAMERAALRTAASATAAATAGEAHEASPRHAVSALVAGIGACAKLRTVSIGGCGMGNDAAVELWSACQAGIASSRHLTKLDCRSNKLGSDGARSLLGIPGLCHLELFDNPAIGRDLESGKTGDRPALAESLTTTTPALRHLDLGACGLSANAFSGLSATLRAGAAPGLSCIELFGNGDQHSVPAWKEAIEALRTARPEIDIAWKEPAN